MKMFILRGIPGAGKSHYAKQLKREYNAVICSADDYFLDENNVYSFDASKLTKAHARCFAKALRFLNLGQNVCVDNTNTQAHEISPYVLLAHTFDCYEIKIITVGCVVSTAFNRQIHCVPLSAIQRLNEQLQQPLPLWMQRYEL